MIVSCQTKHSRRQFLKVPHVMHEYWTQSVLPDKVGAVAAECGLLEESSGKFVVFNFVHVLLSQSSFPRESIDRGGRVIDLYQMISHRAAIPQVCVSPPLRESTRLLYAFSCVSLSRLPFPRASLTHTDVNALHSSLSTRVYDAIPWTKTRHTSSVRFQTRGNEEQQSVDQRWASYSKNVIYYSLLVTPFKSNIVTLLSYYFLATVISYTASYITFSSCPTEVVTVYLPHKILLECY